MRGADGAAADDEGSDMGGHGALRRTVHGLRLPRANSTGFPPTLPRMKPTVREDGDAWRNKTDLRRDARIRTNQSVTGLRQKNRVTTEET